MLCDLAWQELRRDPLFPRLSPVQQETYLSDAIAIGQEQACLYRGKPVSSLVEEFGATCAISDEVGHIAGSKVVAEYDWNTRLITVYRSSIDTVARILDAAVADIRASEQTALDLIIAHELFHHLEATRIVPVPDQLPPITVPIFRGMLRRRRRLRSTSEIAAHAFAFSLTGLSTPSTSRKDLCGQFEPSYCSA